MTKVNADTIRDLYHNGNSIKEISRLLNVSQETIRYHCIKDHIKSHNHCSYPLGVIDDDFRRKVEELLSQGLPKVVVANRLKRNLHDIFRVTHGDEYIAMFKRKKRDDN